MNEVADKVKPAKRGKAAAREKQIAAAEALAVLLADAPADGGDPLSPPALIADPRLAAAAQVWRDRAPGLAKLGCFSPADRLVFALLCIYVSDFAAAQDELLTKGFSQEVPTVSGGVMLRDNPALRRRDTAADKILELSGRFGMTPADRYKLFALRARAPEVDNDLFGGEAAFDRPAAGAARKGGDDGADAAAAPAPTRWDALLGPRAGKMN